MDPNQALRMIDEADRIDEIVDVRPPWICTRRISGSVAPGIITFPSPYMLRKVG